MSDIYDKEELKRYIRNSLSEYNLEYDSGELFVAESGNIQYQTRKSRSLGTLSHGFDNRMCYGLPDDFEKSVPDELTDYLTKMKEESISFQDKLKEYLREKNLKDTDVYNPIGMSEKAFNKIKNQKPDKSISFDMAVMISFGLHLKVDEMIDMLSLAGKSLKGNNTRHIIVKYFFEKENYDIRVLNKALDDNNQDVFLTPKEKKDTGAGIEL